LGEVLVNQNIIQPSFILCPKVTKPLVVWEVRKNDSKKSGFDRNLVPVTKSLRTLVDLMVKILHRVKEGGITDPGCKVGT
jgi:hypothetical protein